MPSKSVGIATGVIVLSMITYGGLKYMTRRFMRQQPRTDLILNRSTAALTPGKTAFIVGGTKGVGAAIALEFAKKGMNVVISGRSDTENILQHMQKSSSPSSHFEFLPGDVSTVKGSQEVAHSYLKSHPTCDYLILTMGIIASPQKQVTKDGIEMDWQVSALSRQIILNEMLPSLRSQESLSRVFIMGAPGAPMSFNASDPQGDIKYSAMDVHLQTVIANEALVHITAQREKEEVNSSNVAIFGLNPGLIQTDIRRNLTGRGFLGNVIEWTISHLGLQMNDYIRNILPVIGSPDLGLKESGTLFNIFGEPIKPNPLIKPEEWKTVYQYAQDIIDKVTQKNAKEEYDSRLREGTVASK